MSAGLPQRQTETMARLSAVLTVMLALSAPCGLTAMQHSDAAEPAPIAALRDRIETAYQARDVAAIEAARQGLLALADDPAHGITASYYAAYARMRQALAIAGEEPEAARGYLEQCIADLRAFVARYPAHAEARAMLGSCYGISTRYHTLSLAKRGLAARRHMAQARAMAPENPWVLLQDGLADFATPSVFGGDRELGIRKLQQAATLFDAAVTAGSRRALWGAAETWRQLAGMYAATGRPEKARDALARAQALMPERQTLAAL